MLVYSGIGSHSKVPKRSELLNFFRATYGASPELPATQEDYWLGWGVRTLVFLIAFFATAFRLLKLVAVVFFLLGSVHPRIETAAPQEQQQQRPPEDDDDPQRLAAWRKWRMVEAWFWFISLLPMDALGTVMFYYPLAYLFGLPTPCTFKRAVLTVLVVSAVLTVCARAVYNWFGIRSWAQAVLTKLIVEAPPDDAPTGELVLQQQLPEPTCAGSGAYEENPAIVHS